MRIGFDYPHDEDQRFDRDEQPRQVPMRPAKGRRNLTTDEKKVKHRLNRQGGLDAEAGGAMNDHQREADLLRAMAVATPAEQAQLAADLDDLRAQRREAARADRETDLADTVIRDTLTPVVAFSRHTASTDWVGEVTDDAEPDDVHQEMLTEASLWFQRVHPLVRADREEFAAQAMGMAQRLASQHGRLAPQAQRAFLDHVGHLHGRMVASGGLSVAAEELHGGDPDGPWSEATGGVELPDDVPDELAFEGAIVTAADGDGVKDWSDKESTGGGGTTDGTGTTTDPKAQHEQSGYGVSGLPQDKPIANETTPMWAPDWHNYSQDPEDHEGEWAKKSARTAADTGNNSSDRNNSHGQVPEEIEALDDPDERPMWPWDLGDNSGQASDVAGTHTPGQSPGDYPQPKKSVRHEASPPPDCAVCGSSIERDPAGEENRTWHHSDGKKHDHEAKPSYGDSDGSGDSDSFKSSKLDAFRQHVVASRGAQS